MTGAGAATPIFQSGDADRTWIRTELVGRTADSVDFGGDSEAQAAAAVADELPETAERDVIARLGSGDDGGTIEVVDSGVSVDQFETALDAGSYSYDEITEGLTQQTHDEAIGVIQTRLAAADIDDATVRQGRDDTGLVLVIGVSREDAEDIEDIQDLIGSRGVVRIDIYHDEQGEYVTDEGALTSNDFQSVGSATQGDRTGPHVPVTVDAEAAERFQQQLVDTGVAQDGGSRCTYDQDPQNTEPCLLVVDDSEVINAFGMAPGLADSLQSGDWAEDPRFILTTSSLEAAQLVSINLRSGPLPAPVELTTSDELPVDESTLEDRDIETEATSGDSESTTGGESTDLETPGFGIGTAVAGLGAAGALLRRLGSGDSR
ncbi:MAG: PGF-CTERM sorting domain-containing protein [Euryarchaeota archaeon]|nr:PGF-CTERM sorting domain-containing protein [Euryarchaeota archaeon]